MKLFRNILFRNCPLILAFATVWLIASSNIETADAQVLSTGYEATDLKTLDPHGATGSQDRILVEMIFNGLVRYPPGNMNAEFIEPDLATGWEVSSDGLTWTFQLRRNVMWHPFENNPPHEFSAEDVIYSLKKAADPKRSAFSSDYTGLSVMAVDKYTVRIRTENPLSQFLFLPKVANRAGGLVVCKRAFEEKGDEWNKTHPVGTGPFMFKSYTPQEKVILAANPDYFRGAPKLAGIDWYYLPELSSAEMALKKGEIVLLKGPREQVWADKMAKVPNIVVDTIPNPETFVAHFNLSVEPLHLMKVRQAIAHAVSREQFVAVFGAKVASPVYSPVPGGMMVSGFDRENAAKAGIIYEYNVEKAKKLLAEAGYPNGFSIKAFTSESTVFKKAYEVMQAQLRKVGINMDLSVVDHSTFHARIRENLNSIVIYVCTRPNPDVILTQFYHSDSIVVSGGKPVTNFSHIGAIDADGDGKIDSVDDLIEAARREVDPKKQVQLWQDAQKMILKYLVALPIFNAGYVYARNPHVEYGYEQVSVADGVKITENSRIAK